MLVKHIAEDATPVKVDQKRLDFCGFRIPQLEPPSTNNPKLIQSMFPWSGKPRNLYNWFGAPERTLLNLQLRKYPRFQTMIRAIFTNSDLKVYWKTNRVL